MRVLLFGVLRERAGGVAERELTLAEGARVGDAVRAVGAEMGDEALPAGLAVAVNQEYVGPETPLAEGDEVALLPPVSGGCDLGCSAV